jgi:MFS family permease
MFFTDISYFLIAIQGLPLEVMGTIITIMGISTFLSSVPLGMLADRYGRKKMLMVGNVLSSIIIAAFVISTNVTFLIVAAVFEGISEAAFSASNGALIAEKTDSAQRNSAFSLFAFAQSMAFGVGSLAIPAVVIFEWQGYSAQTSHQILYISLAVLSLLSTVMLFSIKEKKRTPKKEIVSQENREVLKESRKSLLKYVLASAVIALGAGMVVPLMTAWLHLRYGLPDSISGAILGGTSIAIGLSTLAAPIVAKKIGTIKAIVTLQLASTIFMFATPLSGSYLVAMSIYTTRAFLMNMASPLSQSMIMCLVHEDERGVASGITAALWRLPNALSSSIGTFLMAAGYLSYPFFVAGLLYTISIILFWIFFRRAKMPEEKLI